MRRLYRIIFIVLLPCCLCAQPSAGPHALIFVSDTQSPIWFERLYLKSDDNEQATKSILSAILREQNVTGVVHAGDVTAYGSSSSSWSAVLPFLDSLRARSVPFVAARGNHDYYFAPSEAMRNFKRYVPACASDYSSRTFGPVSVILLNSNFSRLDDSSIERQSRWYDSTVAAGDADSSIRSIITVAHHPPYTNSAVVSGSEEVRQRFLGAFFHSSKSVLFVSGHAHRFEHFRKEGKDFLVIGGGGGLLHKKRSSPEEDDLYTGSDEGRMFHYVRCGVSGDSLSIEVVKVSPGSVETRVVHRFVIIPPQKGRGQ